MRNPVLLIPLLGITACSLAVDYSASSYRCDDGSSCPTGFSCVQGACVSGEETPDAAPGGPDAHPAPDGQTAQTWKDDSAADFRDGTGDHAAVEPRGAIEPFAYYTGGVLERASDTGQIGNQALDTWDTVQAFAFAPHEALARSMDIDFGQGTPQGVGLTRNDFSLTFEGEIRLEAGTWSFALDVDDKGFLDIADANGNFARITSGTFQSIGTGQFVAPTTGWYPIRWAMTDTGGNAHMRLSFQGPGVSSMTIVPRERLRARVDQHPGLLLAAWNDKLLLGDTATTVDDDAPADYDWGNSMPADVGISVPDFFSVRWSGQMRIDVPGDYSFQLDSDDGQRLWIDGLPLLSAWNESPHMQTTLPITLSSGWHQIVVDESESAGNARALLTVASGPDLVGQPLPVDRLRPVEGRAERYATGVNHADLAIPDATMNAAGSVQTSITLTAPAAAKVTAIDVSYAFDHTYVDDLIFTLIAPNGSQTVLRNRQGGNTSASNEYDFYNGALLVNAPVAGTWKLKVTDNAQQDVGTLRDFQLTVHYAGGEAPVVTSASYESAIRDLGAVAGLDNVKWVERTQGASKLAVRLRSCDTADCAGVAWSDPLPDAAGSAPPVAAKRYVQYRVELGSDGDAAASLESIQIDYRTNN